MIGTGVFKEKIGDKEVCFHFGTLAGVYTEEETGISIFEIAQEMQKKKTASKLLLAYFYGAAKAYNEIHGIEEPVTKAQVSVWLDELGITRVFSIYTASFQQPKNGKAPKETGQAVA